MKKRKNLILAAVVFVAVCCIAGGIVYADFAGNARENEEKLNREIEAIYTAADAEVFDEDGFMELLTRTVCTGDYAKTEQAVKAYVRDVYNCFDEMARISAGYNLPYLLSYDNISVDAPAFKESLATIDTARTQCEDVLARTEQLLQPDTVRSYIADKGVSEKYSELYETAFAQTVDSRSEAVLEKMQSMHDGYLQSADGCARVLTYYRDNPNDWEISNNSIYFTSDAAAERFHELNDFIGAGA